MVYLAPEYDWRVGAKKAALTALKTLLGIAAAAVLQYLTNSENVAQLVKDYPAMALLVPLIAGAATFLLNRRKQLG